MNIDIDQNNYPICSFYQVIGNKPLTELRAISIPSTISLGLLPVILKKWKDRSMIHKKDFQNAVFQTETYVLYRSARVIQLLQITFNLDIMKLNDWEYK